MLIFRCCILPTVLSYNLLSSISFIVGKIQIRWHIPFNYDLLRLKRRIKPYLQSLLKSVIWLSFRFQREKICTARVVFYKNSFIGKLPPKKRKTEMKSALRINRNFFLGANLTEKLAGVHRKLPRVFIIIIFEFS